MGNQNSCGCPNQILNNNTYNQSSFIEVIDNDVHIEGQFNFDKKSTFNKLQIAASELCISSGIGNQYQTLIMRLLAYKQDNFFKAFASLNRSNKIQFIDRIGDINLDLMDSLYQNLILNQDRKTIVKQLMLKPFQPCQGFDIEKIKIEEIYDLKNKGFHLLSSQKVAIVMMCGGASSRFYFQDKFLYPLQLPNKPELLTILFNRLRKNLEAKNKTELLKLTIIIIGNELNIEKIERFMKQNKYFYFFKQKIYFTQIPSFPILDENGKICLNFEFNYLRRPKGSACYIQSLLSKEAFQVLKNQKIQYIHFVGSENLAQNPGDPLFLGLTHVLKRKISIKCTDPLFPFEIFDRIIASDKKLHILDKSSLQLLNNQTGWSSLIAMNSMIVSLNELIQITNDYYNKLKLAKLYRVNIIEQNFYDFALKKPKIGKKCYNFQKDIKDLIICSKSPLIVKVKRKQFIPLISINKQYSVKQACNMFLKNHPSINFT